MDRFSGWGLRLVLAVKGWTIGTGSESKMNAMSLKRLEACRVAVALSLMFTA